MTFFYLGLAWHAGIALGARIHLAAHIWLLLALIGAIGAVLEREDARLRLWLLAAMMAVLGAARWQVAQPDLADATSLAHYNNGGQVVLKGVVIDEPDVRDSHAILRVRSDSLSLPDAADTISVHGLVLARAPRFASIGYGDRVQISGALETPPIFEDFNYADYLARTGVYSTVRGIATIRIMPELLVRCPQDVPAMAGEGALRTWVRCRVFDAGRYIFRFKVQALGAIARIFPEPQSALLSGILLGVESGIPETLKEDFRRTGTSHIVAISGFNITIIAGVFLQVLRRLFGERWARPLAISAVALYAILAGADAAVVRAAIMGGLVIFANGLGRPTAGLSALMFAAGVMTLINPGTLWDVGFQLSSAATLGLILYAEPFTNATVRLVSRLINRETAGRVVGVLSEFTILTFAAQLTTLPLIVFYFHQISLVSFLANLVVLPVQPQVMILGGLATLVELGQSALGLAVPLGQFAAWIALPFVTLTIRLVEILAPVDWAIVPIDRFSGLTLVSLYSLLFGVTWLMRRAPDEQPTWWRRMTQSALPGLILSLAAVATVVVWSNYFAQPDGRLHITFLDVGQGDATLIQTPTGRYVLVDGGASPNRLAEQLGRKLPATAREIDLVVTLNPQADGLGGLPVLFDRYEVRSARLAAAPSRSREYRTWVEGLTTRAVPMQSGTENVVYDLGDGAELELVGTPAEPAALLSYGKAEFLLAPGLSANGSAQLALDGVVQPTTALLVPNHAGADAVSALLLTVTNPWAAVVSVGAGNEYGDPQALTLALLESRTILRTDERGWIEFVTDGEKIWTWTER